jgi:hypothetical protein
MTLRFIWRNDLGFAGRSLLEESAEPLNRQASNLVYLEKQYNIAVNHDTQLPQSRYGAAGQR